MSARPDPKKYQKIKHHLYGFHNVTKNFSTGDWLKLVIKKIKEVQKRKKTPILVGGTGLYFKALTDGLVKIPNISLKLRTQIRDLQKKLGQKKFYEKLLKEVKDFIKLRVRKDKSANKAIGVNEIREYLKKQKDLNDTKEKIAIKTRQYAKRQSTWARGNMMNWMKLKPQDINNFLKKI